MKAIFRVDSSTAMGTGHLMRCLTLAGQLRERGAAVKFVSRPLPGNQFALIEKQGFELLEMSAAVARPENDYANEYARWLVAPWLQDAKETIALLGADRPDWLIIDNYALDERWEQLIRPCVQRIMVIDDLANRRHDCDVLLDQNYYMKKEERYEGLVPEHCQMLLGPVYALLRPEFIEARNNLRERDGVVRRILVFFGGSDLTNETVKVLEAIKNLERPQIAVDVVIGATNPNRDKIEDMAHGMPNACCHFNVDNMAELMVNADLAIGAGGSTTWERCYLNLPSIIIITAENQAEMCEGLHSTGIPEYLGRANEMTICDYKHQIAKAIHLMKGSSDLVSSYKIMSHIANVADVLINFEVEK